jgi:hypothetical protein
MNSEELTFEEWHKTGMEKGWVGPSICETHDGLPLTADEEDEFEEGDPCIHILRLYDDDNTRLGVENNHSPSTWRKLY